ncbi:NUDIX hydrolase [Patiriisocius marinus]|uniref:Coenzyme A pyrophosphatase n=1 Tax=Patiriisocius marinus TaxID=1397112 RepID=A0A5J4IVV5_9FLAO|nr:CoA pyrophosphatase [Patiriisocius marinus]GER59054.1 coenzyme A pyrophosphatase [Patiriisocius marinus]
MTFEEFEKQIVKVANLPLPGENAHYKMAPIERLEALTKMAREKDEARKAAVLALFYPSNDGVTHLILILRNTYKGVHSAQVGFPGGKAEPEDGSSKETALRETEEEVGVPRNTVTVLKKMTEIYIPPSDFFVQPFIGITQKTPQFVAQEEEVDALIEVPLSHFLDDAVMVNKRITTSYATDIEVPAYLLNGHVVWGATAMMLGEIRELLKQVL